MAHRIRRVVTGGPTGGAHPMGPARAATRRAKEQEPYRLILDRKQPFVMEEASGEGEARATISVAAPHPSPRSRKIDDAGGRRTQQRCEESGGGNPPSRSLPAGHRGRVPRCLPELAHALAACLPARFALHPSS
ncbi:hypothetical protein MRX96_057583 [Rhipicephalus microplus]